MKVADLFHIKRGSSHGLPVADPGTIPVVSAGIFNNGVVSFVDTMLAETLFTTVPCLSVAVNGQGGTMFASIRHEPFYATDDVGILVPNEHPFWRCDTVAKLATVGAYLRKQRWRFGFGRKAFGRVAGIALDMTAISATAAQINQPPLVPKMLTSSEVASVLARLPKRATIAELFAQVSRMSIECADASDTGLVPFVSASEKCINGVAGFVGIADRAYLVPSSTISVAKDGKPMVARVQQTDYTKNSHIIPLNLKTEDWSKEEMAVLAALIENQSWRYNYGRAAGWERMGPQVIT